MEANREYQMLPNDEANFFAAASHSDGQLDEATAAAVAQAVGGAAAAGPNGVQNHPGLEQLGNSILEQHGGDIPGLKHEQHPPPQQQHHQNQHQPPPPQQQQHHDQHQQQPNHAPPHPHHLPQHHPGLHAPPHHDTHQPDTLPTNQHDAAAAAVAAAAAQQQLQDDQATTQAIAASAIQPPAISTGTTAYYACPVRHCQFLGKKIPEIQRHMGRNQHKGIQNRTCAAYIEEHGYVPACMTHTAMVVDRDYKLAVCRNGSYILSKNEIPAHAKLCEMCEGFDEKLMNDPDYQSIAEHVDLEPFKRVQQVFADPNNPNYEEGMLRRVAGTYRDDNEDNDKRFLCVYCYNDGKLFTMGRKDGNHLYNVHQINPDNRASAWVPCRGMSYRLLGKGFCDQSKFYVAVKSEPQQR